MSGTTSVSRADRGILNAQSPPKLESLVRTRDGAALRHGVDQRDLRCGARSRIPRAEQG